MSSHKWPATLRDGREVVVRAGWDRPLQYFFLTILDEQTDDDEQCWVFSNLALSNPAMTTAQIEETLNRYGLPRPPELSKLLIADRELDSTYSAEYDAQSLVPYLEQTVAGAAKSPAQRAYEAYGAFTGFLTFDGRRMPGWNELPVRTQVAWNSAVARVMEDLWKQAGPELAEIAGYTRQLGTLTGSGDEEAIGDHLAGIDRHTEALKDVIWPRHARGTG